MREIKFRGIAATSGDWEYGFYTVEGGYEIIRRMDSKPDGEGTPIIIKRGTGTQYTGLKDKKGIEIYEGDIVQARYMSFYDTGWKAVIKFGEYGQDGSGDEYNPSKCFGIYVEALSPESKDEDGFRKVDEYLQTVSPLEFEELVVIGNIYENPELLEGETNGQTR